MTTKAQLENALKKLDVRVNHAREMRINKDGELTMKLDGVKLSFEDSPIQLQLVFDRHETLVFLDEMMSKKKENKKLTDPASFWNGLTLDQRDQLFVQRNYPEAPDEILCDCDNHNIEYEKLDDWHKEKVTKEIQILEYEKEMEKQQL